MARSGKYNKSPFCFQLSRSLANSAALFQLLIPAVFIRLNTTQCTSAWVYQVFSFLPAPIRGSLPFEMLSSLIHVQYISISFSPSLFPCHPALLLFVVSSISSLVLLWYHLIFRIRLVYVVWNTRRLLNCSSVNFQVSLPYISTEITLDLKFLILSLWLIEALFHILVSLKNAVVAFLILLFTSKSNSPSLFTIAPRYGKSVTYSTSWPLTCDLCYFREIIVVILYS